MKVSYNWLRELCSLPAGVTAKDLAHRLSMAGVAVDAVTPHGAGIAGVIVAEVRGKRPHPKADKLTLVDVFDGQTVTQVVCGAPNVPAPGEPGASPRVAWARPGAQLPNGLTLSVREVRGIPSPGMLCAEDELGLSEDHAGIVILSPDDELPIGADFVSAAGLADTILELDITPNRPDLLGHVGVAKEVAALYANEGAKLTLRAPDLSPYLDAAPAASRAAVELLATELCPRYLAQVVTGLTVKPSPFKLRQLLARLGVRARSNLVDATNLVLLEWGQPLHAFDLAALAGQKIVVRRGRDSETMKTLDGTVRQLTTDDLVIADAERAQAVAGVMGGEDSEVRATTREVLLESAYFSPAAVRRTARRLKMHTEASHRFERGVDPNDGVEQASLRCAELLCRLGGGRLLAQGIDAYPVPQKPRVIALRPARTDALLGYAIPAAQQAEVLRALGIAVTESTSGLSATVPTSRPDLVREVDLIEEVGRVLGFDRIPETVPTLRATPPPAATPALIGRKNAERARDLAAALGLDEVILFSMTAPEKLVRIAGASTRTAAALRFENPLREELSAMRTLLLPGLLEALRENQRHGQTDVRLFEVGEVFFPRQGALPEERTRIAGVLSGNRPHFLRATAADALDFYDLRGLVEELLVGLGYALAGPQAVTIAATQDTPWLHPGAAAVILGAPDAQGVSHRIGEFGQLHPDLVEKLELLPRALVFELEIPQVPRPAATYQPPSRFPAVSRDLSFFVADSVPAGTVLASLKGANEPLLRDLAVLEDYREAGKVPAGQKGLLLSLTYRADDRTLTDEEVQRAHDAVVARLTAEVAIKLR